MHLSYLKAPCLAICALIVFMAVGASTAQAKWLLLRNGASTTLIEMTGSTSAGRLLVPPLGLTIFCNGSTISAHAKNDGALLLGTATVIASGCDILEFEEVCSVRGSGDAIGSNKITAKGEGTVNMTGAEVFFTAVASVGTPFVTIVPEGEECPFTGVNGEMTGGITTKIENPLSDSATHGIAITSQSLSYGGNSAKVENNAGGNLTGTVTDKNGQKIAAHLRELSGCPTIC